MPKRVITMGRNTQFSKAGDYDAFERVMMRTAELIPMRLLAYCLMPNHWHFVLWPHFAGALAAYMHRLTTTHVRRWRLHRHTVGCGHVYQGAFKSFPVQSDEHLLKVCRYVERNALRAGLATRAEDWPWGSLWIRTHTAVDASKPQLADPPSKLPHDWTNFVNQPCAAAELETLRLCLQRGRPYGGVEWQLQESRRLGLEATLRPRGRPRR